MNHSRRTPLHSAIVQLQAVARKKQADMHSTGQDQAVLKQEARQLAEAIRLLRWIRK